MRYLRNNKILLMIIGTLLIVNIGLLYYGVWGHRRGSHEKSINMRDRMKMKLEKEVGFSKDQLAKYDEMRTKNRDSLEPLFEELHIAKENFFSLMYLSDAPDSVINLYSDRVCGKQQAIDLKIIKHFRSLKALATEEQKPKMDSFLQSITQRMAGGGRRGPGPDKDKGKDKK